MRVENDDVDDDSDANDDGSGDGVGADDGADGMLNCLPRFVREEHGRDSGVCCDASSPYLTSSGISFVIVGEHITTRSCWGSCD